MSGLRSGAHVWRFTYGTILISSGANLQTCTTSKHNTNHTHTHTSSTCPVTSPDCSVLAHRGAQRGSGSVEQRVLTLYHKARWRCQAESAASLEDLLMFCDSCCQQFSSALSSCNFKPSSPHWYRFKKPPLLCSPHAVRSIDCLLWFSFLHYVCRGKYLETASQWVGCVVAILSFVELEEHSFNAIKYTEQTRVFYDVLQVLYVISTV